MLSTTARFHNWTWRQRICGASRWIARTVSCSQAPTRAPNSTLRSRWLIGVCWMIRIMILCRRRANTRVWRRTAGNPLIINRLRIQAPANTDTQAWQTVRMVPLSASPSRQSVIVGHPALATTKLINRKCIRAGKRHVLDQLRNDLITLLRKRLKSTQVPNMTQWLTGQTSLRRKWLLETSINLLRIIIRAQATTSTLISTQIKIEHHLPSLIQVTVDRTHSSTELRQRHQHLEHIMTWMGIESRRSRDKVSRCLEGKTKNLLIRQAQAPTWTKANK